MSRHWRPDKKTVRLVASRDWRGSDSYLPPRPPRAPSRLSFSVVGVVLAAAACAGIAVGLGLDRAGGSRERPGAAIEWNATAAVPRGEVSAEDRAWARRAEAKSSPSTGSGRTAQGVRARFAMCKWGGGTDCVVDGDTFYLRGDKVRIAGIDAPETHPPRCAYEAQLGEAATEKLRALLNSGAVTMTSIDRDRDVYGRLLRDV